MTAGATQQEMQTHTTFLFNDLSDVFIVMYQAVVHDNHTAIHREGVQLWSLNPKDKLVKDNIEMGHIQDDHEGM